jgi:NAD(P) transhydrogenase subunit beta
MEYVINISYIVASALFIFGIKMLGSADTARQGNRISSIGMLIAVVVTLLNREVNGGAPLGFGWIAVGLVIGAAIGAVAAKRVQMTGMPELVALFNGFGGLASLLVGWAEFAKAGNFESSDYPLFTACAVVFAVLVGGITFTGSLIAYLKLSGKMGGAATVFPGQKAINAAVFLALLVFGGVFVATNAAWALYIVVGLALLLGVLGVIPIGGGDMPVVISFLNSFSGIAASAAGFVILNNVLIVAGCLVGASGIILTVIMCKAMNRSLGNVLFGGFGAAGGKAQEVEGEMKPISPEDAYYVLEAAESVIFVPGYGMAVAQAQHGVKELGEILEQNGAEVRYAIHPVAGRMPGHMNVLLAEADVPYEQLCEMDDVNAIMDTVDVAIVIGANDVVNPAAAEDETSPIYGMPIINVHQAKTVFALKRGQGAGFSGLVNTLFFRDNTRMIYGDAKDTMTNLVGQFKD